MSKKENQPQNPRAGQRRRYIRQTTLPEIGEKGQARLLAAKILVVGAGGIGAPLLLYLAAAGVGQIGVIDDDKVALSNLQRQVLYETNDIGAKKVVAADRHLLALNPSIKIEPIDARLSSKNALEILSRFDIVVDGSDNFDTRYLVNDACYFAKKTLVSAALGTFDGQLTTFRSFARSQTGQPLPNYRCLFPRDENDIDPGLNCAQAGVLGAVAGVMGTLAAVEVIKEVLGLGDSLTGRLLLYDGKAAEFRTISYSYDPENSLSGRAPRYFDLTHH